MKILIVEDEKDLALLIKEALAGEGHEVVHAGTAEDGLTAARRQKPDLILLDIMLPGMDGLELIAILRRESQVPVIFLTSKSDPVDRVVGLRLGADDYIAKPFFIPELLARVRAVGRRVAGAAGSPMAFGALEIDFDRHDVRVNGRQRLLAPKEFQLLKLLVQAKGRVLSRAELLESLWGADRDAELSTRTVDQHVARLRRKLLSEKGRVATVKKAGYRFRPD